MAANRKVEKFLRFAAKQPKKKESYQWGGPVNYVPFPLHLVRRPTGM